jgi:flagellar basal body-associated protein FliL
MEEKESSDKTETHPVAILRSFSMFISKHKLLIVGVVVVVVMLAAGIGLAYAFSALGQANAANTNLSATATASTIASPTAQKPKNQHRVN